MSFLLFTVARLRLFAFAVLAFVAVACAHEDTIYTSSVSYCAPPESLLIEQFDVAYIVSNNSVNFNISAASVIPNLTVSASLLLNTYGLHPVNVTLDLCSLLSGVLCPLPTYNFTGATSISLSSYFNVSGKIPTIAYSVPDLEGYIQLTLKEVNTGAVTACVQATLANGWTTYQPAVQWSAGGLALFTFALALWQSLSPASLVPYRLLDLLYLYQTIAVSSFLSLNYPLAYRSFTLNFAWAIGLFTSQSFQDAIDNLRSHTGGSLSSGIAGNALALTNRKLSPYNAVANSTIYAANQLSMQDFINTDALSNVTYLSSISQVSNGAVRVANNVATVTATSSNVLDAGIPVYVNSLNISTTNAFMTVFLVTVILLAVALGLALFFCLVIIVCVRFGWIGHDQVSRLKQELPSIVKSWFLRLTLVVLTPVVLFSFYQWTLKDSWVPVLLSVILFLSVTVVICYSAYLALRSLDFSTAHFHLPLWGQYTSHRYWFFVPLFVASICKSVFISFANGHGEVQVILVLIVEFGVLVSILALKPHITRGGDVLFSYLSIVRLVCTGLSVAFIQSLNLAAIPRVVIGLITVAIYSIAIIVMFFNSVFHLVQAIRPRQFNQRIPSEHGSKEASVLEKGRDSPR